MRDHPDTAGTRTLRCPRDRIHGRRSPLSSRHHCTTVFARLLPDATVLRLEACEIDDTTAQITLRVQSTQTRAPCPLCATPARRIHSDYGRTLADLPWAQYRVSLQLRVRKWFCRNRACRVVSSRNACPLWPSPGRGARCGSLSASWPLAWRWGARPGCILAGTPGRTRLSVC